MAEIFLHSAYAYDKTVLRTLAEKVLGVKEAISPERLKIVFETAQIDNLKTRLEILDEALPELIIAEQICVVDDSDGMEMARARKQREKCEGAIQRVIGKLKRLQNSDKIERHVAEKPYIPLAYLKDCAHGNADKLSEIEYRRAENVLAGSKIQIAFVGAQLFYQTPASQNWDADQILNEAERQIVAANAIIVQRKNRLGRIQKFLNGLPTGRVAYSS